MTDAMIAFVLVVLIMASHRTPPPRPLKRIP